MAIEMYPLRVAAGLLVVAAVLIHSGTAATAAGMDVSNNNVAVDSNNAPSDGQVQEEASLARVIKAALGELTFQSEKFKRDLADLLAEKYNPPEQSTFSLFAGRDYPSLIDNRIKSFQELVKEQLETILDKYERDVEKMYPNKGQFVEAAKEAVDQLEPEHVRLTHDLSLVMREVYRMAYAFMGLSARTSMQSEHGKSINNRIDHFQKVMREQLVTALFNIETPELDHQQASRQL